MISSSWAAAWPGKKESSGVAAVANPCTCAIIYDLTSSCRCNSLIYRGGLKFQGFTQIRQKFPEEGQSQKIANSDHTLRAVQT